MPLYLKLGNSNQSLTSKETAQESTLSYRSDRGKIAGLKYFYFISVRTKRGISPLTFLRN